MDRPPLRETGNPDNPTILFVHGGGISSRMWTHALEHLPEYHCLAPDLPGHGQAGDQPFALDAAVAGLSALLAEKGQSRQVSVVGISVGVIVVLALLQQHSAQVARLFLSGPTPQFGKAAAWSFNLIARPLLSLMSAKQRSMLVARSLGLAPEQLNDFEADLARIDLNLVQQINRVAENQPSLPQQTIPALIAVGEREVGAVKKRADELTSAFPSARRYTVRNAGHAWNLEAPDLFVQSVRAWMTDDEMPPRLVSVTDKFSQNR